MGVWNLNPTFRGTVLTWSSHKDNLACEDNIVKIISRHQRSWHVKDNMLFYYFSVIFAQFPPKESEETSRCCGSVSLLRLLADLRRRRSQTAWVRDEFCCPGKMTSSRHLHYKHFISCEKDKETHFSFSKKKKTPHYSVWPWHPVFIRWVSQFSGQKGDESSDPAVCFGYASGTQLWEHYNSSFSILPQHRTAGCEHWKVAHPDREVCDREIWQEKPCNRV